MKSWKTTVTGILAILGAVIGVASALIDGDPATNPDFPTAWAAILAGVGLIMAKDSNVTGGTVSNEQVVVPKA